MILILMTLCMLMAGFWMTWCCGSQSLQSQLTRRKLTASCLARRGVHILSLSWCIKVHTQRISPHANQESSTVCLLCTYYLVSFRTLCRPLMPCGYSCKASCANPGLSSHLYFLTSGHSDARAECKSVQMSKIKWWLNPIWQSML